MSDVAARDEKLVEAFEAGTLAAFPHSSHVRLTIIYLSRHGREGTLRLMAEGLRRFATLKGSPGKFHVTQTRAWVELIESARIAHPEAADALALISACPDLLDRDALDHFYSPDRLAGDAARAGWVEPDRASIQWLPSIFSSRHRS